MKKLFAFLGIFLFISCSDEKSINEGFKKNKDTERRLEIKEIIKSHSEGLDFFYKNLVENKSTRFNRATKSSNRVEKPKIDDDLKTLGLIKSDYDLVRDNLENFLIEKKLDPKYVDNLSIISEDFSLKETVYLSDYNFEFSNEFYDIALKLINIDGNSINDIEKNQNELLNSVLFKNLSLIEKNIILLGAETYLDSYKYWDSKLIKWESKMYSYREIDFNTKAKGKGYSNGGFWESVKHYAKADGKGAIAGGIGAAVRGAVLGSLVGGAGAVPGAITGGIGGAIAGGIGNSILEAMSLEARLEDEVKLKNGKIVPEMWNKVILTDEISDLNKIEFKNGEFIFK